SSRFPTTWSGNRGRRGLAVGAGGLDHLQRNLADAERPFDHELAALLSQQGAQARELAAPDGFDIAVARTVVRVRKRNRPHLEASRLGAAADFHAIAGRRWLA